MKIKNPSKMEIPRWRIIIAYWDEDGKSTIIVWGWNTTNMENKDEKHEKMTWWLSLQMIKTPKYVDEDETLKDDDEDKVGKTRIGR